MIKSTFPKGPNSNDLDPNVKLEWSEKIGYAAGDMASCLFFGIFMNYLIIFYTDVFGISAAAVGTMIFVVRTWDWINDPIMGSIADRTNTKMGKFRPWLLWMIVPYMLFGILTFTTFDLSQNGKLIYAYFTYTALIMVYTMINVPYSALMGVMTSDSGERTTLASYRFVGAYGGVTIVSASLPWMVSHFGGENQQLGYTLAVSVLAIGAGLLFLVTFKTSKERIRPSKHQRNSILKECRALFRNGPWVVIMIVSILSVLWVSTRISTTMHYFKYVAGNESWGGIILSVQWFASMIFVLSTKSVSRWFGGKKNAYIILCLTNSVVFVSFYFIPSDSFWLLVTNQLLMALVSAPVTPLFWAMIADTADYGAVKLGYRSTGLIFSAGTFSMKIGWSIGPAIALWIMGFTGFEANQEQSEFTKNALVILMSFVPAALAVLTALTTMFYKINPKLEAELRLALSREK